MSTLTRIADSRYAKTTTLAFLLLGLCTLVSTVSVADPGGTREVTERGTASLAGLDVLTPKGLRLANWRIQQMAQRLCLQIVNIDIDVRDAATCVGRAVADAQQKLDTVIQARLAEREAHAIASKR
jgi:UrcA family protein